VKKLYISGIREEHTEEQLRDYFTEFGNVTDVDIIADKATGKKRGFAFVSFDDYDPVDKCVCERNEHFSGTLFRLKFVGFCSAKIPPN